MADLKGYYVFPKKEQMMNLKRKLISSDTSFSLCSISSSNKDWYENENGIYTLKKDDDFNVKKIQGNIVSLHLMNEFFRNGLSSNYHLSPISDSKKLMFILSWANLYNLDGKFTLAQAGLINEDVYNIYMIMARKFLSTTTPEDLSRYADLFVVFDMPGRFNSTFSEEYLSFLEKENNSILSLRK